ncbi:MAG TPA: M48 family metalloprotease [Novosphingobium sp.]|nr:M48 family metalloprotease [Novosphingobium sp.]
MNRAYKIAFGLAFAAIAVPGMAHAAGFDVETATRAYLDTLQGPARAKSDAYFEGGYWLILWGALVSILTDALLLRFRLTATFREWAEARSKRASVIVWLTALAYTIAGTVLTFPWALYTAFFRERQYGLMNQAFGGWFGDYLTNVAIALVIMPLLVTAVYSVIRRFPKNWWLLGTGVFAAFMGVGVLIAPVYIAPLFNTYTELPAGPVRERIVAMAKANNVPAEHIYLFDASKQTKRISANVSGIGPTIRISLNDNLLNRTSETETAAVMGHELGHYVLGHVMQLLAGFTLLAALALFLVSRIAPVLIARYGAPPRC